MAEEIDKNLLAFLEEDDFEKKYNLIIGCEKDLTDSVVESMAASLDFVINDGPLDGKITQLKSLIRTRAHFESRRLR